MVENTVRVTCAKSGCGTFSMDKELIDYYKQTGDTFYCPAGHSLHYGETTEAKLRKQIKQKDKEVKQLEREITRLERHKDTHRQRESEKWQRSNGYERLARELYEQIVPYWQNNRHSGVVELTGDHYTWICRCGGYGETFKDNEQDARHLYEMHQNQSCGLSTETPAP